MTYKSIGCVDYGNNNFFEVMKSDSGGFHFGSHDVMDMVENDDGSWSVTGQPIGMREFLSEVPDYHLEDVIAQLGSLLDE